MKISGARRCLIINTPSRAVTLYRPFLSDWRWRWSIYKDLEHLHDVIVSILFLALLSPALVATLAGLETASLELNAHLRVQPAHCVYDFYFLLIRNPLANSIQYQAVVRYAVTLQ